MNPADSLLVNIILLLAGFPILMKREEESHAKAGQAAQRDVFPRWSDKSECQPV
jgi:hypothetical protein